MPQDITERTYQFALRVVEFCRSLPNSTIAGTLGKQLLRAGTSIGANVEEANAAHTHEDFAYRTGIVLREARETHYWLRLLADSRLAKSNSVTELIDEAEQLKRFSVQSQVRLGENPSPGEAPDRRRTTSPFLRFAFFILH